MAAFERSHRQQIIVTSLVGVLIACLVVFAGLVLVQTEHLGGPDDVPASATVRMSSLELMKIDKTPLDSGSYVITMEALSGMTLYAAFWTMVAIAVTVGRLRWDDRTDDQV